MLISTANRSDRDAMEEEHAVLLRVVNKELEKHKSEAAQRETQLEKREREDVKNTIMLGVCTYIWL